MPGRLSLRRTLCSRQRSPRRADGNGSVSQAGTVEPQRCSFRTRLKERRMRSRSLTVAAVLISAGTSTAQTPTSNHSDVSSTQPPETTGQARSFEDRWSAQAAVPYLPPGAPVPTAPASAPEATGQAPTVPKKKGAEMEGAGDMRPAPDAE